MILNTAMAIQWYALGYNNKCEQALDVFEDIHIYIVKNTLPSRWVENLQRFGDNAGYVL